MSRITTLRKRAARTPTLKPEPSFEERVVKALAPADLMLSYCFPWYRSRILKRIEHALSNGNAWDID